MFKLSIMFIIFYQVVFAIPVRDIKTLEADFIQKIIEDSGNELIYKGSITIKRPNKIMWEYKEPIKKTVYIKNNYVLIVEPQLEQVIFTTLDDGINLIEILDKSEKVSKNLYRSHLFDKDFLIEYKDSLLDNLEYGDNFDNLVKIKLFNQRVNKGINNKKFNYNIPSDYDIIRR